MGSPTVLEESRAIDTHAHQPTSEFLHDAGGQMMRDAADRFGADLEPDTYENMIEEYRAAGVGRAVLLGWDAETNTGNPPVPNDYVAEVRDEHSDFFIGFGSVDPLKDDCVEEAIRCVEDLDLSGFKFQQIAQGFDPSDPEHEELWATIEDLGVPVVFHGGNSTLGACSPGGRGLKIKYGNPMLIDDVAADHPDLQILIAHPAYPWEKEQLAICQQKGTSTWISRGGCRDTSTSRCCSTPSPSSRTRSCSGPTTRCSSRDRGSSSSPPSTSTRKSSGKSSGRTPRSSSNCSPSAVRGPSGSLLSECHPSTSVHRASRSGLGRPTAPPPFELRKRPSSRTRSAELQ
ncbi:amidohydrolase 2 [Haloterrigena salina JCM 13891]|uniref:Amidohydrolase 2 n=1 Tax=Haloterrigena salina JCM 13891 TaxID=1227488 RepID=M0C6B6_9EURY|nr:amidohydrolase 2 [Haloterrigena salina JCM 13891]